jgi:hypothetical protein
LNKAQNKNSNVGCIGSILVFILLAFLYLYQNYEKETKEIDIRSNYAETEGYINRLTFTKKTKNSPRKYTAIINYKVDGATFSVSMLLRSDWRYNFDPDIKAEEGDYWKIAYASTNKEAARVIGDLPLLPPFYEQNPDKILGNKKIELIEVYHHGVDTIGIVTHIDCKKDSSKAIIEYPSTDGKKYKIELEVAFYNDKKAIYKAQGLPTVRIGDSLKIRYSSRVPQVFRLLESAPKVGLSRY